MSLVFMWLHVSAACSTETGASAANRTAVQYGHIQYLMGELASACPPPCTGREVSPPLRSSSRALRGHTDPGQGLPRQCERLLPCEFNTCVTYIQYLLCSVACTLHMNELLSAACTL